MSQITIAIPDDTNRQLSVAAQASGLTIEQFVHDLILEALLKDRPMSKTPKKPSRCITK